MPDPADIHRALAVAAQIVARDGPAFLPVFLRLEDEVRALDGTAAALARAVAMGGGEGRKGPVLRRVA